MLDDFSCIDESTSQDLASQIFSDTIMSLLGMALILGLLYEFPTPEYHDYFTLLLRLAILIFFNTQLVTSPQIHNNLFYSLSSIYSRLYSSTMMRSLLITLFNHLSPEEPIEGRSRASDLTSPTDPPHPSALSRSVRPVRMRHDKATVLPLADQKRPNVPNRPTKGRVEQATANPRPIVRSPNHTMHGDALQ